jgi:hypothetical protein
VVVYLDPANFKNIGDGHTIADQINEVLAAYGLGAIPPAMIESAARNWRFSGWPVGSGLLLIHA